MHEPFGTRFPNRMKAPFTLALVVGAAALPGTVRQLTEI